MKKEEYDFKCPLCGKRLIRDGKHYGTNWVFFICKDCAEGFWIDTKIKKNQWGEKF